MVDMKRITRMSALWLLFMHADTVIQHLYGTNNASMPNKYAVDLIELADYSSPPSQLPRYLRNETQ